MHNVGVFRIATAVVTSVVLSADLASAARQSGLQFTPDGKRTLISKDVGDERWAITLNQDDGSITGNVFHSDGGPPQFVWCDRTGMSGDTFLFNCKGADACQIETCSSDAWTPLQDVAIPQSFFLPLATDAVSGAPHALETTVAAATDRASGLQTTPDGGRRVLINKDVGNERWAITRHASDHTVTGNVFSDPSAPPTFLWCEEQDGVAPGKVTLACFAAPPCAAAPCGSDQWTFVADVTVDVGFFGLRSCSDVSGNWRYSERGSLDCTSPFIEIDGPIPFGGSGNATITQNGCGVSVTVSAGGATWTMNGSVDGDVMTVSGPSDVLVESNDFGLPDGVSIGGTWQWNGTVDSKRFELQSSGDIDASFQGMHILSCSVEGTHGFSR